MGNKRRKLCRASGCKNILNELTAVERDNYSSHLYSESEWQAVNIPEVKPTYADDAEMVDGRVVIRDNFDKILAKYPEFLIFGEDSGNIGDVNQGLEGLQENMVSIVLPIQVFVKLQY